jgi:hypothetical protein
MPRSRAPSRRGEERAADRDPMVPECNELADNELAAQLTFSARDRQRKAAGEGREFFVPPPGRPEGLSQSRDARLQRSQRDPELSSRLVVDFTLARPHDREMALLRGSRDRSRKCSPSAV